MNYNLDDGTKLYVTRFLGDEGARTTWGEFRTVNHDDTDMLEEVADDLRAYGRASCGGGAAPLHTIQHEDFEPRDPPGWEGGFADNH